VGYTTFIKYILNMLLCLTCILPTLFLVTLKMYVHKKHIKCYMYTQQTVNAVCTYEQTVNVLCTHNTVNNVCAHIRQLMLYVHTTDIKSCVYTLDYLT